MLLVQQACGFAVGALGSVPVFTGRFLGFGGRLMRFVRTFRNWDARIRRYCQKNNSEIFNISAPLLLIFEIPRQFRRCRRGIKGVAMAAGYVYVLANGAAPGLAQIGKGPTVPTQIAEELTNGGAVPSPFVVAYEHFCGETDAVHTAAASLLTHADVIRRDDSYVVFKITVSDAVKAVARAVGARENAADDLDLELRWDSPSHPWHELMEEADRHYYGLGDYFEDEAEALKLYREAARLGSPSAYRSLGDMYRRGSAVRKDIPKAMEYYKAGAKLGNAFCLLGLAWIFANERHAENSVKAFSRFVEVGSGNRWERYAGFPGEHAAETHGLLVTAALSQRELYSELIRFSCAFVSELQSYAEKSLRERDGKESTGLIKIREMILEDLAREEAKHG
jgi:hypothetical protein